MLSLKNIKPFLVVSLLVVSIMGLTRATVSAETITCADGSVREVAESDSTNPERLCKGNGGVKSGESVKAGSTGGANSAPVKDKDDCNNPSVNSGNCAIIKRLVDLIKVLTALVGVVVVIMITVGGIQYSASRDNPQAMAAAKGRITNAILALILYLFMFAFLQYLVPGGVL